MGVDNIFTFDAHDPRVQNAIPLYGFDSFNPPYQFMKALLRAEPKNSCATIGFFPFMTVE